jgi:hypothetical protein
VPGGVPAAGVRGPGAAGAGGGAEHGHVGGLRAGGAQPPSRCEEFLRLCCARHRTGAGEPCPVGCFQLCLGWLWAAEGVHRLVRCQAVHYSCHHNRDPINSFRLGSDARTPDFSNCSLSDALTPQSCTPAFITRDRPKVLRTKHPIYPSRHQCPIAVACTNLCDWG